MGTLEEKEKLVTPPLKKIATLPIPIFNMDTDTEAVDNPCSQQAPVTIICRTKLKVARDNFPKHLLEPFFHSCFRALLHFMIEMAIEEYAR